MILVLFGTNPYNFDRLARAVEAYAADKDVRIVAQIGNTNYVPKNVEAHKFVDHTTLMRLLAEADIVITQGGFGSLMECIENNKKTVAVPRMRERGECQDDGMGQMEIVKALEQRGMVVGLYDIQNLAEAVEKAKRLKYARKSASSIPSMIRDYIEAHDRIE